MIFIRLSVMSYVVRPVLNSKYALPIVVFIIGLILTLLAASHVVKDNRKQAYQETVNYSERHANRIKTQIQQDVFFLGALASLVDENSDYWINQFDSVSQHIMSGSSSMISIQWSPHVNLTQIEEHRNKIKSHYEGFTEFNFHEGAEKRFTKLLDRGLPLYMVSQVYPETGANSSILGYYSVSDRFEDTLLKMKTTQQPFLSDRVFLLQDSYNRKISEVERQKKQNGLLMYYPVFNQNKSQLLGYFISAIQIDAFFEKYLTLDAVKSRGYRIKVFDHGPSGSDDPVLYQSKAWVELGETIEVSQLIDIYGRPWEIQYQKSVLRTFSFTSNAIITLICGVFISLLIACIVRFSLHSKEALKRKLAKRTKELQYLVEHDTLTGVHNRYALCNHFEILIEQKIRFSLIAIDVDKFKHINDTYGHCAGDTALKYVAERVKAVISSEDMLARMGGDEFSILTRVTDKNQLTDMCDKICKAVNVKPIMLKDIAIPITISIGAKRCHTTNIDDLYHEVDQEMYKSKNKGRNDFSIAV